MKYRIEDSKPHPLARYDFRGFVTRVFERREAVLRALVEHCGGIEAARERVSWTDSQPWEPCAPWSPWDTADDLSNLFEQTAYEHIMLDGAVIWIGGHGPRLRWRERFTAACPESVINAVPAELRG